MIALSVRSARISLSAVLVSLVATTTSAQGPGFTSPGLQARSTLGQTTQFSTEFNPAFGFAIDGFASATDNDGGDDGFDITLRLLEINAAAYVDPNAWAYVVLTSEELESPEIEEAAIEYIGFEGNSTVKVGRFFVDFGKQMQNHLEELRTLERPLVLREYLGEELAGTGIQFDHWFPLGDATPVRFSIGVFASLAGGGHGHDDEATGPEIHVPQEKDIDELSFSARLTGMTDVGESGLFQLGASVRHVPEFALEFEDATVMLEESELANTVAGIDVTYEWSDETGEKSLLLGGEALVFDGDLGGELDNPTTPTRIDVVDDTATGFYVYADYGWSLRDSVGVQYSSADAAEDPDETESELDFYFTHDLTEFRRLRFGVTIAEGDEDSTRAYVQFTNYFGSHAHGINW